MSIGESIKHFRIRAGLTQQELANKIGVQLAAVSKYETGIVDNLPIARIERIADALGVTGAQIMGWDIPLNVDPERKKLFDFIVQLPDEQLPTYCAVIELPIERLQAIVDLLR